MTPDDDRRYRTPRSCGATPSVLADIAFATSVMLIGAFAADRHHHADVEAVVAAVPRHKGVLVAAVVVPTQWRARPSCRGLVHSYSVVAPPLLSHLAVRSRCLRGRSALALTVWASLAACLPLW